jgi:RNA 2',3'-cyclic 3'-phosphodiesterase
LTQRVRLFIAIKIPDPIRHRLQLAQESLRPVIKAKWSHSEQLHLTLKFLGETPDPDLPRIIEQLKRITPDPQIHLSSGSIVCFPPHGPIRIIAAELNDEADCCLRLQTEIDRACHAAGFQLEPRRWRPHVTLARVKERLPPSARSAAISTKLAEFEFFPEGFTLFQSRLDHTGPAYVPVATFP